jgi:hypothetical protein
LERVVRILSASRQARVQEETERALGLPAEDLKERLKKVRISGDAEELKDAGKWCGGPLERAPLKLQRWMISRWRQSTDGRKDH